MLARFRFGLVGVIVRGVLMLVSSFASIIALALDLIPGSDQVPSFVPHRADP